MPENFKLILAMVEHPQALLRFESSGRDILIAVDPVGIAEVPQEFDRDRDEDLDRIFPYGWLLHKGRLRRLTRRVRRLPGFKFSTEIRLDAGLPLYPPVAGFTALRCLVNGRVRHTIDVVTAKAAEIGVALPLPLDRAREMVPIGPSVFEAMLREGVVTDEASSCLPALTG